MEGDPKHPKTVRGSPHFNPLPPHGGRLFALPALLNVPKISIHSLRMEGDTDMRYS